MATYRAVLPRTAAQQADLLEALTGFGGLAVIFDGEFPTRDTAVQELGDECGWRGLDRSWWDVNLSRTNESQGAAEVLSRVLRQHAPYRLDRGGYGCVRCPDVQVATYDDFAEHQASEQANALAAVGTDLGPVNGTLGAQARERAWLEATPQQRKQGLLDVLNGPAATSAVQEQ